MNLAKVERFLQLFSSFARKWLHRFDREVKTRFTFTGRHWLLHWPALKAHSFIGKAADRTVARMRETKIKECNKSQFDTVDTGKTVSTPRGSICLRPKEERKPQGSALSESTSRPQYSARAFACCSAAYRVGKSSVLITLIGLHQLARILLGTAVLLCVYSIDTPPTLQAAYRFDVFFGPIIYKP